MTDITEFITKLKIVLSLTAPYYITSIEYSCLSVVDHQFECHARLLRRLTLHLSRGLADQSHNMRAAAANTNRATI